MALRDKLVDRATPYLEPGEQVRHVFLGQTGPKPYFIILTALATFWMHYRIVVVTDRRILVLNASRWAPAKPKGTEPVARLSRQTRLGPLSGLWARMDATGEKMWVHKRFHKDVAAADAELVALPAG